MTSVNRRDALLIGGGVACLTPFQHQIPCSKEPANFETSAPLNGQNCITPEYKGARESFDAKIDESEYVQAALNDAEILHKPVVLLRRYGVAKTIFVPPNVELVGVSRWHSGLHSIASEGSPLAGPILSTWDMVRNNVVKFGAGRRVSNIRLSGHCDVGLLVSMCVQSTFDRITTDGCIPRKYDFCFEMSFSNNYSQLESNGSGNNQLSNFKINKTNLNSTWDQCYTANSCDFNLHVNMQQSEYSTGVAAGFMGNTIRNFAAQGAKENGIYIENATSMYFENLYTENTTNAVRVGSGKSAGGGTYDITFINANVHANRIDSKYSIFLDGVGNIRFEAPVLHSAWDVRLGKLFTTCSIVQPRLVGNLSLLNLLKRTADAPQNLPFFAEYQKDGISRQLWKTASHIGWRFREVLMGDDGNWITSEFAPPIHSPD